MSYTKYLLTYALTAVVFFAVDMLWLGILAKGIYRKYLGGMLSEEVNWTAAIIFYLIFIAGILVFVVEPAVERGSWMRAIALGAFFGIITYATYDLTNLATLKGWPLPIVFIDIAWGAVLTGSTSVAGFLIMRWVGKL
ncbi:MAG: DUF2177 family protein [Cyclobacteriaceae bacterium]|mgnify:CR=1 FL=1|jgi:uncharacterized membrane protein|nr:DUF2177 domain-containing protein [Cytophagales bacterium]HNP78761.1 DUF2177 family protein [Cyclobacteriaceae bacterium]HQQ81987.1 DUF2177 family protein [Cyclobacteriaceae bacterium]